MEMGHRLTAVGAGVGQEPEPAFGDPLLLCDRSRRQDNPSQQHVMAFRNLEHRRDMPLRQQQHVHRRLGIDVTDRQDLIVLIDALGGNSAGNDFTEDAIRHVHSHVLRSTSFFSSEPSVPTGSTSTAARSRVVSRMLSATAPAAGDGEASTRTVSSSRCSRRVTTAW